MLYYDKKWCKISYLEEASVVMLQWFGFASSEQFKEACNTSLELLIQKRSSKMIADNRESKVVGPGDQKWMNEEWFPKAYEKGYRASAVIVGQDLFNQVAVKRIVNEMDKGMFTVQFFTNLEDGKYWLKDLVTQVI